MSNRNSWAIRRMAMGQGSVNPAICRDPSPNRKIGSPRTVRTCWIFTSAGVSCVHVPCIERLPRHHPGAAGRLAVPADSRSANLRMPPVQRVGHAILFPAIRHARPRGLLSLLRMRVNLGTVADGVAAFSKRAVPGRPRLAKQLVCMHKIAQPRTRRFFS